MSDNKEILTAVPTVLGGLYQNATYRGKAPTPTPDVTLNTILAIRANDRLDTNDRPSVKYLVIGRSGHYYEGKIKSFKHKRTDAALWGQIPFVLRDMDNDLTDTEREKYRLRKIEEHNGVSMIAYYMRVLPEASDAIVITESTYIDAGGGSVITEETTFTPSSDNAALSLSERDVIGTPGNVTYASDSNIDIEFNENDVNELRNVGMVINNDPDYASISEVALAHGVDKSVTTTETETGDVLTYTEAIMATITMFITGMYRQPSLESSFTFQSSLNV